MSHPNSHHDPENEYPSDDYKPVNAKKRLSPSKLKKYSHKLLKESGVVTKAKHEALKNKMK